MWPILIATLRTYAPYITFPAAFVIGVIGYNVERTIRGGKPQPWKEKSALEEREDRHLHDDGKDITVVPKLETFQPRTVLGRNDPPKS